MKLVSYFHIWIILINYTLELKRLRGNNYQLDDEISNMVNESNNATANRSILSILSDPILLLPIVLVVTIQAGHQFSGINAVNINIIIYCFFSSLKLYLTFYLIQDILLFCINV